MGFHKCQVCYFATVKSTVANWIGLRLGTLLALHQNSWATIHFVTEGNLAKFEQNDDLNKFLQSTGNSILVEAAGRDVIWGIGLGASNPKAQDPNTWRGQNLLGFVLTEVREQLS